MSQKRFCLLSVGVFMSVILLDYVQTVDRGNFKTCEHSSFCRRLRKVEPGRSSYELQLDTLKVSNTTVTGDLINADVGVHFNLLLTALTDGCFRLEIDEAVPRRPRYRVQESLQSEPAQQKLEIVEKAENAVTIKSGDNKVILLGAPFRIDLYSGNSLVISGNAQGLLRFEHQQVKQEPRPEGEAADMATEDPGAWEENFKSHQDSKPYGPMAVGMDITFVGAEQAYGLPEHADNLPLKSTKKGDPYRLYNLDVFEYELHNNMALYAAIPFIIAHSTTNTVGVFWHNAAETWVDIHSNLDDNMVSSIVNFVSGSTKPAQVDAHFMSETGVMDVFFCLGPKPHDVLRQYTGLTGTAPLPPYFSLGYHQCRWNYNDQDDVNAVSTGFDMYDIPMDVMWLDIEHTDNKKYFTWDTFKFTKPIDMQQNLTAVGRKLVVIVDPHVKRDGSYDVHTDAETNGYYVKTKEGADFEGWCWPGSSSYLDFLNPAVREYFANRYKLSRYHGSTEDLYIWNDMNEPAVFNGPEVTMPKDCVHYGGIEHRELHNQYGLLMLMTSYHGLLNRADEQNPVLRKRPFILTRSAFAGAQRYAAIWTGDNAAEWEHLAVSIPMCLSFSLGGMTFCGADVGGFFKYPNKEMFIRWYQAGAFLPFYRAHSHMDTKRREPWLYDTETTELVREVIRKRYSFLPLWYTLFYQHNITGAPVTRPLWFEFPTERATFTIDNVFLVGNSLLVRPVVEEGVSEVSVYFPGTSEIWYDIDTYEQFRKNGAINIPVDISKIPVYQRGGSIIPRKMRVRRASTLMHNDPFTLVVALDVNGTASGRLYIDDGQTFEYLYNKKMLYLEFHFKNNQLTSRFLEPPKFPTKTWLERVLVVGIPPGVTKAQAISNLDGNKIDLETSYDSKTQTLTIRKPALSMAEEWKISLL